MPWPTPVTPDNYLIFVRGQMRVPTDVLPDGSDLLALTFQFAVDQVSLQLACASPDFYALAVYNLGGDFIINYGMDAPDAPPFVPPAGQSNPDGLPYFAYYRNLYKIFDFTPGVVQSTSDEGTSVSLVVQDALSNITLDDLQRLKTPYGMRYLQIAQKVGTLVGLT